MPKNKDSVLGTGLRLFAICFFSALILSGVNMLTKDKIAENNQMQFAESCRAVMGEAIFEAVNLSEYGEAVEGAIAKNAEGEVIGICIKQSVKGYNSGLVLVTGILSDGKTVSGIDITEHEETPGLGAEATADWFKAQFTDIGLPVRLSGEGGEGSEITAITGATKTSEGIKKGVNNAAEIAKDFFAKEGIL